MSDTPPRPAPKTRWKDRIKGLFELYGSLAIIVFIGVCAIAFAAAWIGVTTVGIDRVTAFFGWEPSKAAETATTIGAAYVVYRFTLPLRIGATAVLTPAIAKLLSVLKTRRNQPSERR
ncbi:MAG: FAM210A/B-like domain-containing protein [Myxococcaceae bacterium]